MSDTEVSSRRAEANRRNAQKSTGPKTAGGKERSRYNAVKHGMRAKTDVLPGEDAEALQARLDQWTADLDPRDDVERFLVARAVTLSWQLERADRAQAAHRAEVRSRSADWLAEQADEVASLARRLFWDPRGPTSLYPHWKPELRAPRKVSWSGVADDPDDPARLVNRLESSALGAAWLLDRWDELRAILEAGQTWLAPDRFRAIRLLGRQPMDVLDDDRVLAIYRASAAMEPGISPAFADLAGELDPHEEKRLLDRIEARLGGLQERTPDARTGQSALLELIAAEEERLEEALAAHLDREPEPDFDGSDLGERLRRYQLTCDRALLRVLETLRRRHREADSSARSTRKQAGTPEPVCRISGLLSIIAEARAAKATKEANGPAVAVAPQPTGSGRDPDPSASPIRDQAGPPVDVSEVSPGEAEAAEAAPVAVVPVSSATNEANPPARPGAGRPTGLLALLFCAGLAASLGASIDRNSADSPPARVGPGLSSRSIVATPRTLTSSRHVVQPCLDVPVLKESRSVPCLAPHWEDACPSASGNVATPEAPRMFGRHPSEKQSDAPRSGQPVKTEFRGGGLGPIRGFP